MSEVPSNLRYAATHEWVRAEEDGTITVGITDHAQGALGDLVFVETPAMDGTVQAGEGCAVVESVKAASDVYAPVDGVIVDTNGRLTDEPELVNTDPYGDGWIMRIKPDDADSIEELMDADDYEHMVSEQEDEE
ncbi:glycine cleavage system H protein [Natronocella acetinitrilica]|uniref:Glycine cleavage system H protein n=1 Tax=Natronocella acetinitrilica TaxID=414046 RepID=A0AAE3G9A0_9GAMM|nr:glycine cleavage system protein GcvH [Natronocella acetinitrilica]MCP1676813.1 glycine cleavage system H protein [Natronocella acetinitrilica]